MRSENRQDLALHDGRPLLLERLNCLEQSHLFLATLDEVLGKFFIFLA